MKKIIPPLLLIGGFYFLLHIIGVGCPIKFVTGISCPGCGMTRSAYSLLRLDFPAAFYYHPLFPLVFVLIGIFLLHCFDKIPKKAYNISINIICTLFVAVWLARMIFGDGAVVAFEPEKSIFAKILDFLRKY